VRNLAAVHGSGYGTKRTLSNVCYDPTRTSQAKFAVMHNGPHHVIGYDRRARGAAGETAAHFKP
jgi:hypothetical protein